MLAPLTFLERLDLFGCTSLRTPPNVSALRSLQIVNLMGCISLAALPDVSACEATLRALVPPDHLRITRPSTLAAQPAATVVKQARCTQPPGRVRHLFKKLDVDGSGALCFEEIEKGLANEFGVDALAPHVLEKLQEAFAKVKTTDDSEEDVLSAKFFGRFYAEALFRHFDKDDSGTLELAEFQEALGHLVKPKADGTKDLPVVAFPPEVTDEKGEVHLPVSWFWSTFKSMD